MPPRLPGIASVPCTLGGVKILIIAEARPKLVRQKSRSAVVGPHASSAERCCTASGGGAVGKGCVGDATSPGTSLFGTGRSSTGKTGTPVSRFST